MKPLRIHIGHHFFGSGNLGDDLMLAGFLSAVERSGTTVELTCATACDAGSQRARSPQIQWLGYDLESRQRGIRESDVWCGVGDSPFQTRSGPWFLDHLTQEVDLCRQYGKRMFFLGVGVNDLEAMHDPKTRPIVEAAQHIWTRDAGSAALLKEMGGEQRVTAGADLAHVWLAKMAAPKTQPGVAGLALYFEDAGQLDMPALEQLVEDRRWRYAWLVQETRRFTGSEMDLYCQFSPAVRGAMELRLPDYAYGSIAQMLERWGCPEVLCTSRYHAALVGAWLGCRLALVQRCQKLACLAQELELKPVPAARDAQELAGAMATAAAISRQLLLDRAASAEQCVNGFLNHALRDD
jgi:polysaccharide pyruvyl transferase WcaK-like protein